MKIVFLEAVQNYGGARKSTLELANRIKSIGHEVLIVDFWGTNKPFISAAKEMGLQLQILQNRNEPYIIHDKSKLRYLYKGIKYFFIQSRLKKKMSKVIDDFKPDVINVNNRKCLNLLKPNSSYKIDYFARGWFAFNTISKKAIYDYRRYNPRFLTVSQSTRQAIFTGGLAELSDIKVLTSVIEKNVFEDYKPEYYVFGSENPIRILHSAGFLNTKGQHVSVEVAKKLRDEEIPFLMTFTGIIYKGDESENYFNSILRKIEAYNLQDYIKIVLNKSDVIEYFKQTDVLIHPSWTEGLPRVCLEALSFGKPVIANPVGGVTDVVIHNMTGFIIDFNDIEQYVFYIEKYYANSGLYEKHSKTARQLIKQNYLDIHQIESIKRIYPL